MQRFDVTLLHPQAPTVVVTHASVAHEDGQWTLHLDIADVWQHDGETVVLNGRKTQARITEGQAAALAGDHVARKHDWRRDFQVNGDWHTYRCTACGKEASERYDDHAHRVERDVVYGCKGGRLCT